MYQLVEDMLFLNYNVAVIKEGQSSAISLLWNGRDKSSHPILDTRISVLLLLLLLRNAQGTPQDSEMGWTGEL